MRNNLLSHIPTMWAFRNEVRLTKKKKKRKKASSHLSTEKNQVILRQIPWAIKIRQDPETDCIL